eukprot:Clim_evm17s3 gene=Clim_evmTU17s3
MQATYLIGLVALLAGHFADGGSVIERAKYGPELDKAPSRDEFDYCGLEPTIPGVRLDYAPLLDSEQYHLLTIQIVNRHGDRLYDRRGECWTGDTAAFECPLQQANGLQGRDRTYLHSGRLFEKSYMEGRNNYPGNCGTGQLTTRGFHQHLINGRGLREEINASRPNFLPKTHKQMREQVYVRSDDMQRTMESAEALIEGLFPDRPHWHKGKTTHILPLHTMDIEQDDIFPNGRICPKYEQYVAEWQKSSEYKEHFEKVTKPLMDRTSNCVPGHISEAAFYGIFDCIAVHVCQEKKLPKAVTTELLHALYEEAIWQVEKEYMYPSKQENAQVGIGFLLYELMQFIYESVTHKPETKIRIISGHDTTLMPLLIAMDMWDGKWPRYAAFLAMEVYRDVYNADEVVRFTYNGEVLEPKWCTEYGDGICSFEEVVAHTKPLMPQGPRIDVCTPTSGRESLLRQRSHKRHSGHGNPLPVIHPDDFGPFQW